MKYKFEVMTQQQAEQIAYHWHYEDEYAFYDMEADQEDLEAFLDVEKRGNTMFAVMKNNEVIGFLSINKITDTLIDIGLGMKPDLTGKGNGINFLKASMDFIKATYTPEKITLSVATFNQRAINVYKRIGFKEVNMFMQETNESTYEFLKMVYEC
ncbi:MAG: GNAT family N-acetyltransferase [Bacillaceae bacterium]